MPFVREGLERGEAILVALPPASRASLRGALDGESGEIRFVEMEEVGRNPARIIPAWRDFLDAHPDGAGVRGIGEPIWAGRSDAELDECARHESLLNRAFDTGRPGRPWTLMGPYDSSSLPDEVLQRAEESHPEVSGARSRTESYARVEATDVYFDGELDDAGPVRGAMAYTAGSLTALRALVAEHAGQAGLGIRTGDIVLAANEIATNSIRYGGGHGVLEIRRPRGDLVCDFRDDGRLEDPLAGRARPSPAQHGGRGLWLANQLCDLVQIRRDREGSLIRLTMKG